MTDFAKDVDPENTRGEYPRPQMVRGDSSWMNLNGLWGFDHTPQNLTNPPLAAGATLPLEILVPFGVESPLSGIMKQ